MLAKLLSHARPHLDWHDLTLRERACFPELENSRAARELARFRRVQGIVRKVERAAPDPALAAAFAESAARPFAF